MEKNRRGTHVCITEPLCWTEEWMQHSKSTIPPYGFVWDDVRAEATEKEGGGRGTGKALASSSGGRRKGGRGGEVTWEGQGETADCWARGHFSGSSVLFEVLWKLTWGRGVVQSGCGEEPRGQRGFQLGRVCAKKGPQTHFKEPFQPPYLTWEEGNTSG